MLLGLLSIVQPTVCSDLKTYAEKCMFDIFGHFCRLDYVGRKDHVKAVRAVIEVCKQISALSQNFRDPKMGTG